MGSGFIGIFLRDDGRRADFSRILEEKRNKTEISTFLVRNLLLLLVAHVVSTLLCYYYIISSNE